jgi:hypothetical protein
MPERMRLSIDGVAKLTGTSGLNESCPGPAAAFLPLANRSIEIKVFEMAKRLCC